MKIIFLINSSFPYYAGGIETWLYNLSKKLCHEHDIKIISHDYKPYPLLFNDISNEIKFYKFRTMMSYAFLKPFVRSYMKVINLFIGAYSMGKVLKKIIINDEDYIIIALDTMFSVKAGTLAKKINPKIKLIASSRGPHAEIYSESFPLCKKLFFSYESRMLAFADVIWANGYDTMKLLASKGFQSQLMRNGVDFKKFDNDSKNNNNIEEIMNTENIKIVSVGSLNPVKGIYELIDAISVLNKKNVNNIEVYFIGKGETKDYIKYAQGLKIEDKIHFLGHKNNVEEYIKKCQIVACLSGGSGMGMAVIEAMVSKTPIIAWDSPVYRQFNMNNKTMLLVKEKDVQALVDGIIEIIDNYDKFKVMAQNANTEAKSYDWSNIAKEFIENVDKVKVK